MKRLLALLVSLALAFTLAACGGSSDEGSSPSGSDSPAESETDAPEGGGGGSLGEMPEFQEVTAVDNDQCAVRITGIEEDSIWGLQLNAELENRSSDKTYMFSVEDSSINGVECSALLAAEVTAGNKAREDITFTTDALEKNGVGDFTDIELDLRVYDSGDWSADPVARETVHVYPYGQDKASVFVREPQPSDTVLADNDQCSVIVTGYGHDDIWGYMVNLYLLNKSDEPVMFSVEDAALNGYMADPFFAYSVSPGKCAFSSLTWYDSTLEENGITEVETIGFTLTAHSTEDYTAPYYVNEQITLNP